MTSRSTKVSALNIDIGKPTVPLLFREEVDYRLDRLLASKDNKNFFKTKREVLDIQQDNVRFQAYSIKLGNESEPNKDYIIEYTIGLTTMIDHDTNIDYKLTSKDMHMIIEPFIKKYIVKFPPNKVYKLYDQLNYILEYDDFVIHMLLRKYLSKGISFYIYYLPFNENFDLHHLDFNKTSNDVWILEKSLSDDHYRYTIASVLKQQNDPKKDSPSNREKLETTIHDIKADNLEMILHYLVRSGLTFEEIASDINKRAKEYVKLHGHDASISISRSSRTKRSSKR